jgi:hypothetical protein
MPRCERIVPRSVGEDTNYYSQLLGRRTKKFSASAASYLLDFFRQGRGHKSVSIYHTEHQLYHHIKKLMYTVRVGAPDPRFGAMLLEQFGGAN